MFAHELAHRLLPAVESIMRLQAQEASAAAASASALPPLSLAAPCAQPRMPCVLSATTALLLPPPASFGWR